MSNKKPFLAFRLLSIFLPEDEKRFLLGDYAELYKERVNSEGMVKASLWLWLQVIFSIPKFIENKFVWGFAMFKNYFKMARRILVKNGVSSIVNIIGLSIALSTAIFAYVFFDFHYNRDVFHKNAENIFLVCNKVNHNGVEQTWGNSPLPIGPKLKADFPSVEKYVRINYSYLKFRHEERVFNERVQFVDEGYFGMFHFPLLYSTENPLSDPNSVVLSKEVAVKYFGEGNPVGKDLIIFINDQLKETYTVTAVMDDPPKNSSFFFNILLPFKKQFDYNFIEEGDWNEFVRATFIQLNNPSEIGAIENVSDSYLKIQNDFDSDRPMTALHYEPLHTLAENSYKIKADVVYIGMHPGQTLSTLFIGLALLVLAVFNYMNISISSSAKRFKEIGIRKVLGTSRKGLIYQFLSENVILCSIALVLGILFAKYVFTPWFNNLWGVFNLEVNLWDNIGMIFYLFILLLSVAFLSGLYPALYISSFKATSIFRSKINIGGSRPITKVLLTFQLMISFMTVVYGIVFIENNEYWSQRDWGYAKDQVLFVPLEYNRQFETYKNAVSSIPAINSVAGSYGHIGWSRNQSGVVVDDVRHSVDRFDVGFDYMETLDVELKQGRSFNRDIKSDIDESVIVNETFVDLMQWQEPLNNRVLIEEKPYYVIAVAKDFHYQNFMSKIEPAIMKVNADTLSRYLSVSVAAGKSAETLSQLESIWKTQFPDSPFEGRYQDEVWGDFLPSMAALARLTRSMAIVGLLITCMGIFAQISISISSKMKEIGIRKVLGSSNFSIIKLINKSFVKIALIATIMGIPLSYFAMSKLLESMWDYHKPVDWYPFAVSFSALFIAAAFTTLSQIYKAVRANPVDTIRME